MKNKKKIIYGNLIFFIFHYATFLVMFFFDYDCKNLLNLHGLDFFYPAACYAIYQTLEINFTLLWWLPYHIIHVAILEVWLFDIMKCKVVLGVLTVLTAILASAPMALVLAFLHYRY